MSAAFLRLDPASSSCNDSGSVHRSAASARQIRSPGKQLLWQAAVAVVGAAAPPAGCCKRRPTSRTWLLVAGLGPGRGQASVGCLSGAASWGGLDPCRSGRRRQVDGDGPRGQPVGSPFGVCHAGSLSGEGTRRSHSCRRRRCIDRGEGGAGSVQARARSTTIASRLSRARGMPASCRSARKWVSCHLIVPSIT